MRWLALLFALPAAADDFDYWVLALSWQPSFCAIEDGQGCPADRAFLLHGLWPQYEEGYPEWCETDARPPSRSETEAMVDLMGSSGLAWHQWRKHGSCSGLSGRDYLRLTRQAWERTVRPEVLVTLDRDVSLPPKIVEEAMLEVDPRLSPDMVTVRCRAGYVYEVRLCLTRDLEPRLCGRDVVRDCAAAQAQLPAPRQ